MRRVTLQRLSLHYVGGLVLHTASSGAVPVLSELRLAVEQAGRLVAIGASRTNIAYLSGLAPEAVETEALNAVGRLDWSLPFASLHQQLDQKLAGLSAPARMLLEMTLADGAARVARLPLWQWLRDPSTSPSDAPTPPSDTNQSLFREDDAATMARAKSYAARGFTQIKLRVGFGDFASDLARFRRLRDALGSGARLSVDANGQWREPDALNHLRALAALGAESVEQPLPGDDWDGLTRLAAASPVPVMLDESLGSMAAVERMVAQRAAPLAHLKLAKLGGLDRLMLAGRQLGAAGIGVMVGQMNEGVVSTLAAAHAALALEAPLRELYGADGLANDPARPAPAYEDGLLHLPQGPGLGLTEAMANDAVQLWQGEFA